MHPLHGNMFFCKTKKFLAIIKEIKVDTDAETWMKGGGFNLEAMIALQNHYYGNPDSDYRKQVYKDNLNMLFYTEKPLSLLRRILPI